MADTDRATPGLPAPPEAVERLGRAELAPLVDVLAGRFAAGTEPVAVTLGDTDLAARSAVADLLGAERVPAAGSRLRIDRLLASLELGSVEELRAAVEAVRGPLPNRRAERQAAQRAREALWQWLAEEVAALTLGGDPERWRRWVEAQRSLGARGGVAAHRRRLEQALAVLRALPADGVSLAGLADDSVGDPHALDPGRSLATLALDAVATALEAPRPGDAAAARALWDRVGVICDPLSSTVLALGLPASTDHPLGRWLAEATGAGEPVVLTLANLARWPVPALAPGDSAYVVENPSLVAEAATGGWTGPPLVCSSGRPSFAVVTLVRQLGAAGGVVRQHADFDVTGVAITAWLADRAGTVPWHMDAADYRDAVRAASSRPPLVGTVPPTPWDPALREAMEAAGVAVHEEQRRAALLAAMDAH